MAKVKDQDIPTDQFEETLDPPLEFKDQYRRVLSEGIDWPKLPAGEEVVTYSKLDSRPAQRSDWKYFNKPKAKTHRRSFSDCAMCWHNQYFFESSVNPCHSAGSRHYVTPWEWVPGAQNTAYNKFMQECLDWETIYPGVPFPRCDDLRIYPSSQDFCPSDEITFTVPNAFPPVTMWATAGTCFPGYLWKAPTTWEACPPLVTIYFEDSDARKGCYEVKRKQESECCCATTWGIALIADSLLMACDQTQTIEVDPEVPGCPPYTWSLGGGGTLTPSPDPDHASASYHSPLTNPNCVNNPTITVIDACGDTTQIKIAVSCGGIGNAYAICYMTVANCSCYLWNDPPNQNVCRIWQGTYTLHRYTWNCFGVLTFDDQYSGYDWCYSDVGRPCPCFGGWCLPRTGLCCYGLVSDTMTDLRTPTQKAAGCCPLNPATGLPF